MRHATFLRPMARLACALGIAVLAVMSAHSPAVSGKNPNRMTIAPSGRIGAPAPTRPAISPLRTYGPYITRPAISPYGRIGAPAPTRPSIAPHGPITMRPAGQQILCTSRLRELAGSGHVWETCASGIVTRTPDGRRWCREFTCG